MKGVFCANFAHARGIWDPCRSVWCGKCYVADSEVSFHINTPEEDEGVIWKRRKESTKFLHARPGDFILSPFQCDVCSFRNIKSRSPVSTSVSDTRLLAYIRRANLDVFWSRSPGTVTSSVAGIRKIINYSNELNMPPPLEPLGPWPVEDKQGLRLAICTLKASQEAGKNDPKYTQYDTVRKIGSSFGNHYEASITSNAHRWVLRADKGNTFFTDSPARSEFFNRFQLGLKSRMGRDVRGDIALDYQILHKILSSMNNELLHKSTNLKRRRWLATAGAYFTISFVLALRGNETLMLDLKGLVDYIKEGRSDPKNPHIVIPLLGRFKGEDFSRHHILLAPNKSDSGFEPRKWLEYLIQAKRSEGIQEGPAFCDMEGYLLSQQLFNDELEAQLLMVKEQHPELFSIDLDLERINTSRSFRKGSTSRAHDLQLASTIIDANN